MSNLSVGMKCRAKTQILRTLEDDSGRLCRITGIVPESRRRWHHVPEYRVELLAMPVTAHLRGDELEPVE